LYREEKFLLLQPIYRLSVVLFILPILKGRENKSSILVIALRIVFRDEKPIIVSAAALIASTATLLTDENWNMTIMIVITIKINFVIMFIPLVLFYLNSENQLFS
jgi:hypothetical protein